jgi:HNH endonuclease
MGELAGYEVREYLLEKWGRRCAHCDKCGIPLQVEHIQARATGGSNRVSNLCLACATCNRRKGAADVRDFLRKDPDRLKRILATAKAPLRDAAAMNAIRSAIGNRVKEGLGLPVAFWSGGRTKFNRIGLALPKQHWIDAACVGDDVTNLRLDPTTPVLIAGSSGHGLRQRCIFKDKKGRIAGHRPRRVDNGFASRTGDLVKAVVTRGKYKGTHIGRINVRSRPSFRLNGVDVPAKSCSLVQRRDGYAYEISKLT